MLSSRSSTFSRKIYYIVRKTHICVGSEGTPASGRAESSRRSSKNGVLVLLFAADSKLSKEGLMVWITNGVLEICRFLPFLGTDVSRENDPWEGRNRLLPPDSQAHHLHAHH